MSDECDKCEEHCLDCKCHWSETKEDKQQFLEIVKEKYSFDKNGNIYCRECKNEYVACVCMGDEE